jgi:hypothetical protein
MTSRTGSLVAPPAWGAKEEEAPRAAVTGAERSPVAAGRASAAEGQRHALELRVSAARGGTTGAALALGFALLWAFLLLGVAGPASAL